jgi:hypothetical protein
MMEEMAKSVEAVRGEHSVVTVDLPVPVTGGTELDDWPGGILQKYSVLRPMLVETMRALNFTKSAMDERIYICEEDAVGVWNDQGITFVSFPTTENIDAIKERMQWKSQGDVFALVNNQFFLDPMSKEDSKRFLEETTVAYKLEQLNMRGPNALPCRGILYRVYPGPFVAARRLDGGGYVTLATYEAAPSRAVLEELFMEDSRVRDKDLTMQQRVMRMIPQLPQ